MRALVYPDASVHVDNPHRDVPLVGGGATIECNGETINLKRVYFSTNIDSAEVFIGYLAARLAEHMWSPIQISLKTDSQNFANFYNHSMEELSNTSEIRRNLDRIYGYFGGLQTSLDVRWIRGHQSGDSQDAVLNRKADKLAYDAVEPYLRRSSLPDNVHHPWKM